MTLVLSIFPGIGLLDRAFEEEGFCVVRGPDVLWGGDVRTFHPPAGRFDGVIGGPPCQTFSPLANLVRANGYEPRFGNLIPEFERCVAEAAPRWFLMENVREAPRPRIHNYGTHWFLWNNAWLGEEQNRVRKFTFGVRGRIPVDLRRWMTQAALELPTAERSVVSDLRLVPIPIGGSGKVKHSTVTMRAGVQAKTVTGGHDVPPGWKAQGAVRYSFADACELQGLPPDFLEDAPFKARAKLKAVANGVPMPLGKALAKAILGFLESAP